MLIVLVVGGLFAWQRLSDPNRAAVAAWNDAGVACLDESQRLQTHIHPVLTITVDGAREPLPSNAGVVRSCTAELHTHETDGTIHLESTISSRTFTLGQFLAVYGKPFERAGYQASMTVDGVSSEEGATLILKDKQQIVVTYTAAATTPIETTNGE